MNREIKSGGRTNGQSILNAYKLLDYIKGLEDNQMYGIIKRKNIIALTKTEIIPTQKIKDKIKELKKEYKIMERSSDFIIADTIQPKIQVLEELLGEEK